MYFLRHIQNENVYPCVDLGVYPDFPDRVLRDHCWFTEQIANRNLSIQMHLCISWKDQYGACRILSQFQSKHLRCCTILGMEKGLKICFMFTFLVYSGSHFWFVYLITHCSFFKLLLDWKLVSFGPFWAGVILFLGLGEYCTFPPWQQKFCTGGWDELSEPSAHPCERLTLDTARIGSNKCNFSSPDCSLPECWGNSGRMCFLDC